MTRRKLSLEEAVAKMRERHGDRYEYPMSQSYGGAKSIIRIICRAHGEFLQRANNHLYGHNCPRCGAEFRSERAREKKRRAPGPSAKVKQAKGSSYGGMQSLPFWS